MRLMRWGARAVVWHARGLALSRSGFIHLRPHACTLLQVESAHKEEVCSLIRELAAGASAETGAVFGPKLEERLCAYARSVAHFPTAVKEFEWRNGWFYSLTQARNVIQ